MWTVTSYLPSGKSLSDSRSMWITNVSPTFSAGSPVWSCSIPDASMATWPAGLRTMSKMAEGAAGMGRVTSMRSVRKTVSGTRRASRDPSVPASGSPRPAVSGRLVVHELRFDDLARSGQTDGTQRGAEARAHEGFLITLAVPDLGNDPPCRGGPSRVAAKAAGPVA